MRENDEYCQLMLATTLTDCIRPPTHPPPPDTHSHIYASGSLATPTPQLCLVPVRITPTRSALMAKREPKRKSPINKSNSWGFFPSCLFIAWDAVMVISLGYGIGEARSSLDRNLLCSALTSDLQNCLYSTSSVLCTIGSYISKRHNTSIPRKVDRDE